MLELIVLGQIPGTTIQLSISSVLYIMSCVALTAAAAIYVWVSNREMFLMQQQLMTIELLSL